MSSPMSPRTVIVHGATGVQGGRIAAQLASAGYQVRATSRRPAAASPPPAHASTGSPGVTLVAADLADRASLAAAYADAAAVVIQLPLVFSPAALEYADNVLAALDEAAVARAVLNAGGPVAPAEIGVPYLDARTRLARRLPEVVERSSVVGPAGPYMENLALPGSARRVLEGTVAYPLPADAPVPWLALDDLGRAIAALVGDPAPPAARVVSGPEALTGAQVAAELTDALGRVVSWQTITPSDYAALLVDAIGPDAAAGIAAFYDVDPADAPPAPDPSMVVHGATLLRDWARGVRWDAATNGGW